MIVFWIVFWIVLGIAFFFSLLILVNRVLERKEFEESVDIYQLPYDLRSSVAHLKHPETNDGIWEWNREK